METHEMLQAFNRTFFLGTFCDHAKAINCVNHSILMMKLAYYGEDGNTSK
jgi:hypothetical protein